MKRRAVFGQWKTPPQVLYPSSGSGMKKSTSMPAFKNPSEMANVEGQPSMMPDGTFANVSYGTDDEGQLLVSDFGIPGDGHASGGGLRFTSPPVMGAFASSSSSAPGMPASGSSSSIGGMGNGTTGGPQHHPTYESANEFRRAMSYQDIPHSSQWSDGSIMHPGPMGADSGGYGDGAKGIRRNFLSMETSPGSKRTAESLGTSTDGKSSDPKYVNPRNALLRPPSIKQEQDAESGGGDDAEERRLRRLARNRASARLRRLKKRTMASCLEVEVEDLVRSTEFLKVLDNTRRKMKIAGHLDYPRQDLENAFCASRQPVTIMQEETKGAVAKPKTSPPEDAVVVEQKAREQVAQLDINDLRQLVVTHLLSGTTEEKSINVFRRSAAVQMFLDHQISWAEMLRTMAGENATLLGLLSEGDPSTIRQSSIACVNRRSYSDYALSTPGMKTELTKDQPPPDLDMSKRKKQMGTDPFPCSNMYDALNNGANRPTPVNQIQEKRERLRQDLLASLQLSEQQKQEIKALAQGIQKEQLICHAFHRVCCTMSVHSLLDFPYVEEVQDGFRGVLLANQMDKFQSWAKKNVAAIDALDIAPPPNPNSGK